MRKDRDQVLAHQQEAQGQVTKNDRVILHLSWKTALLLILGMPLVLLTLGFAGVWLGREHLTPEKSDPADLRASPAPLANTPGLQTVSPGPWGELEWQRTFLETPDECLPALTETAARWVFKGASPENLAAWLLKLELTPAQRADLLDRARWQVSTSAILLNPHRETVRSLDARARQAIYAELARYPENAQQQQAVHWATSREDEFFAGAGISTQTRAVVRRFTYPHGAMTLLADQSLALAETGDPAQRVALQKALTRRPAALVKLRVDAQTDLEALMRYWGVGGCDKEIRPALESVARLPEGRRVSVLAVLTLFARERLFTFPCAQGGGVFDCHWTSFNFFHHDPEPAPADDRYWTGKLAADYASVFADPRYGDIAIIARPNGEVMHSCVYLADNLVFTKGSGAPSMPWMIMTMADVLDDCAIKLPETESPQVSYYRSRNL